MPVIRDSRAIEKVKRPSKIALLAGGYLLALVVAMAVVRVYIAVTDTPDRQASSGMHAFGDSILFLGVFALASVPATCTGLYFLRPFHAFWKVLAACALVIAATGLAALAGLVLELGAWSTFSPIRILLAPPVGLGFLLCGLFAPTRAPRAAFFGVVVLEALVFAGSVVVWLGKIE